TFALLPMTVPGLALLYRLPAQATIFLTGAGWFLSNFVLVFFILLGGGASGVLPFLFVSSVVQACALVACLVTAALLRLADLQLIRIPALPSATANAATVNTNANAATTP